MTDDAPDIPPALTANEWQFAEVHRPNRLDGPAIRITPDNALRIGGPGMPIEIRDANDVAALIALANELLRRFDDPRAITPREIADIRCGVGNIEAVAERIEPNDPGVAAIVRERAARLDEFADALDSYMPTYRCAECGGVFIKTAPDGEAEAEYQATFTDEEKREPRALVCDDCYSAMGLGVDDPTA